MDMPMVICSLRKKALCEMHTIVTSIKKKKRLHRQVKRYTEKERGYLVLKLSIG